MRLHAGICVLNEETYLGFCLDSIYMEVDHIIVVEGSTPWNRDFTTEEGLSSDRTPQIIEGYPDPEGKIEWVRKGPVLDMSELRNEYWARTPEGDLLLVTDADEVWEEGEISRAFRFMQENPGVDCIHTEEIHLIWDFRHRLPETTTTPRVYRRARTKPYAAREGGIGDSPANLKEMVRAHLYPPLRLIHCGWVRDSERKFQKGVWTDRYSQHSHPREEENPGEFSKRIIMSHLFGVPGRIQPSIPCEDLKAIQNHPYASLNQWEILDRQAFREMAARLPRTPEDAELVSWDSWRENYHNMSDADHVQFYWSIAPFFCQGLHGSPPEVSRFLENSDQSTVLEIGGGNGNLAREMIRRHSIETWTNIELIEFDLPLPTPHYREIATYRFRWWETLAPLPAPTCILSHIIEHLCLRDLYDMVYWITRGGIQNIYIESPIERTTTNWKGYQGSHYLEVGWDGVYSLMRQFGFFDIDRQSKEIVWFSRLYGSS